MKLKDIKVGDYVAARVKRYAGGSTSTERCRVKAIDGRYVKLLIPAWQKERRVYFTVIDATWADHEAARLRAAAADAAKRSRERAAWDARRAAERERFEQGILPAFKGLPAPEGYPEGRCADLAEYIAEMMLDGGSTTVMLREDSLTAIAARIMELSNALAQNALTAQDLPEAGWGFPSDPSDPEGAGAEPDCDVCQDKGGPGGPLNPCPKCNRYPDIPAGTVIEIPLSDLGLLVPDGDA